MTLATFLAAHGITQTELAEHLGCDSSAISHKLAQRRPWFGGEIAAVLAFLRTRTGEDVTFEQLFGVEAGALPPAANDD